MRKIGLTIAVLVCATFCHAGQDWWETAWPLRVKVTLDEEFTPSQLPGDDVGVAEFYTGGETNPDGSDIRVCTVDNAPVKQRVLCAGPGDLVRVAFSLVPGVREYYIYYGNKSAASANNLEIKRGLLQESWRYIDGKADAYPQAVMTLAKSQKNSQNLVGSNFVPRIFTSVNPFTGDYRLINFFTGWFIAPQAGDYLFIISSNNASFLSVDSKLLLEATGWHGPEKRAKVRRSVTLDAGLHRLDVLQVTPWGNPTMAVYWREPDKSEFEIMPDYFFAKVYSATPVLPQRLGVQGTLDIRMSDRGEAIVNGRYIQRRVFEVVGDRAKGDGWQWDFGDGQVAVGRKVSHVFLHDGVYAATAKNGLDIVTQRYYVSRDWPMVTRDTAEEPIAYGKIVGGYDLSEAPAADVMIAVELMKLSGNWDGMMRQCEILTARPGVTVDEIRGVLDTYCDMLIAAGQAKKAAQSLEKLAAGKKRSDAVTALYVKAGDIYLYELEDVAKANHCYHVGIDGEPVPLRKMSRAEIIAAGDAYLAAGDYSQANDFYSRVGLAGDMVNKNPSAARGNFARQAEDYLRRGEYESQADVLTQWENAIPTDRLAGYLTLLRVRMLGEQGLYRPAVNRAVVLVKANPQSQFAPQLLLYAAKYAQKDSRPGLAGELLQQLLRDYPESPLCDEAKKLLNEVGKAER